MPRCCVRNGKETGGHQFPRDMKFKKLWFKAIRRVKFEPKSGARVCHKHFKESDYEKIGKYPEATGLPKDENNQTKITELSLVAVLRKHLLATCRGETPRVQRKLTLCFNPGRPIRLQAKYLSGLSNTLLEEEPLFDGKTCRLVETFISFLKKPVCLVSHGGNYLDFPVLKKQLNQAKAFLPADIRYIDSLDVFYCVMEGANAIGSGFPHSLRLNLGTSYKLKDVYRRLLGRAPSETHRAEADCLLVLECAVALADKFVDWVDGHSKLFSEQKPLGN